MKVFSRFVVLLLVAGTISIGFTGCSGTKKAPSREEATKMIFDCLSKDKNAEGRGGWFNIMGNNILDSGIPYNSPNDQGELMKLVESKLISIVGVKGCDKGGIYTLYLDSNSDDESINAIKLKKFRENTDHLKDIYPGFFGNEFEKLLFREIYFKISEKSQKYMRTSGKSMYFCTQILKNINVTGIIKDAENQITAEYTTEYEKTPFYDWDNGINRSGGKAVIQLYDDGWRVAEFK